MKPSRSLILRSALGAAVFLLAGLSALHLVPPRAVPASAPASTFSAGRAMADLEIIAREPHPAGSEAQSRVRSYIIDQVKALGLAATVETYNQLSNILVSLPGSDPTKTVLITGHYDSHPPAPGAGDNGVSVAAMLESIRVLHAREALRNTILFLFTDGEELGWIGAYAYIRQHPEAKDGTGVLLVFDARPGNAPLSLIKTSPGDAWMLRQVAGLPLPLWTGSWKNLQERTEVDTDFDAFQSVKYTGMVMENEAYGTRYHTTRDSVDAISPNQVQAFGNTMVALANRFGSIDLEARTEGPDLAFFSLSLVGIVAYPYWVMVALTSLGILALLFLVVISWRRKEFSPGRFIASLLGLLAGAAVITACAQLAWGAIKSGQAAGAVVDGGFEGSATWQAVLMAAGALLVILLLVLLNHRLGWANLAPAAAILFLLAGFALDSGTHVDNPFKTAWIAWPFIGGVVGLGSLVFIKRPYWKAALLAFAAWLVFAVAIPRLWMATYTREDAWMMVLLTCAWAGLLAPTVEGIFGRSLKEKTVIVD